MKTKITTTKSGRNKIGVLDVFSGLVTFLKGETDKIANLEKDGNVKYHETRKEGKIIQKEGKYSR
jgi:hypothetical protein